MSGPKLAQEVGDRSCPKLQWEFFREPEASHACAQRCLQRDMTFVLSSKPKRLVKDKHLQKSSKIIEINHHVFNVLIYRRTCDDLCAQSKKCSRCHVSEFPEQTNRHGYMGVLSRSAPPMKHSPHKGPTCQRLSRDLHLAAQFFDDRPDAFAPLAHDALSWEGGTGGAGWCWVF